jgi:hypothetical protein
LAQCAEDNSLVFPAHFANPYAVKIRRYKDAFALGA